MLVHLSAVCTPPSSCKLKDRISKKSPKGYNHYRGINHNIIDTIHAEIDAAKKLPYIKNKRRKKIIDLLVIRMTRNRTLKMSEPCHHCIKYLNNMKNYKVRYVYYSRNDQTIVRKSFHDLLMKTKNGTAYCTKGNR